MPIAIYFCPPHLTVFPTAPGGTACFLPRVSFHRQPGAKGIFVKHLPLCFVIPAGRGGAQPCPAPLLTSQVKPSQSPPPNAGTPLKQGGGALGHPAAPSLGKAVLSLKSTEAFALCIYRVPFLPWALPGPAPRWRYRDPVGFRELHSHCFWFQILLPSGTVSYIHLPKHIRPDRNKQT